MALRCLVFSSHEEMVQPLWQVLTELGIEGEYCRRAVDAVEKVTTQPFQIVITDWDDQPEATFLLKTSRDLKASQRPLTLAIVTEDARPEALKSGANSVLLKPVRAEQVRDTMSTACELLRAKQHTAPAAAATPQESARPTTMAAAAGAVAAPSVIPVSTPPPSSVTQVPESTFRAGEFLQPAGSAPGAQFETEDTEAKADELLEEAAAEEPEALAELEPTASAVEEAAAEEPVPKPEPDVPLTGWAALQTRLMRTPAAPKEETPASELLAYGETPSFGQAAEARGEAENAAKNDSSQSSEPEAEHFADLTELAEEGLAARPHSQRRKIFLLAGILACVAMAAVPRTRMSSQKVFLSAVRAGRSWLNPPPAPVAQAAPQHDSFGQSGDEYKLPVAESIPDATTDPSQVRVVPLVDPTAKPDKNAAANGEPTAAGSGDTSHADSNQADSNPADPNHADPSQSDPSQSDPSQANPHQAVPSQLEPNPSQPAQAGQAQAADNSVNKPATSGETPASVASAAPSTNRAPETRAIAPQPRPVTPPMQKPAAPRVSANNSAGIPSSLKSQMASTTPAAGGNKPPEAAMSSIEPVTLPESVVRDLLIQPVVPEYPAAAKASGQRGSVVLQVLIGRDGVVRDAKFISGSFVFARAAIDAVKQWRFKPYSMNGRAVSAQSVITLSFKPPA